MDNNDGERTMEALLRPYKTVVLAEVAGVSRQAVALWRNGRSRPDIRTLPRLASFLKIDLGVLTGILATESHRRDAQRRTAA